MSKQEYIEETIGNTMDERSNRMQTIPIGGTSSISQIQALERLSKQSELATTPQTVIPIVSTAVPSTLATSMAPTTPPVTTLPIVGTISTTSTSTSAGTLVEKIDELIKAMEQMSIQATELKKLIKQMTSLETN